MARFGMKEEMGGVATHAEALRALNLQPPRISSHLDLLTDPLAPLRAPSHPAAAHARVSAARSLRGAFHARLNGPLASLQAPTAHRANTASTRSPRAVKRLSGRSSRAPRARSQPATDKENVLGLEEEEDEGFEDVWGAGREESRPVSSGRDAGAADNSWAGDITRLSSALDQLAALCNATQRSPHENPTSLPLADSALGMPAAHSSLQPFHHHHPQYPLHNPAHHPPPNPIPTPISPTCPVHGSGAMHASLVNPSSGDGFLPHQESDSGGSSGGHVASTPPSPTTGSGGREFAGMARKVGVALRALGGRLAAWSRGADGSQGSSQLSSSSSSSSSPVAGRHSGKHD